MTHARTLLAGAALAALWLPAQAGLFDDDEARKAILDLRAKVAAAEQRLAEQSAAQSQLADQVQQLRRSLLDLNTQNEQLRAELARQRGNDEQLARDVAELQRRQSDIAQGVDERVRRLEPQKVTVDGQEIVVEPDERRAYDEALAALRGGDFDRSAGLLTAFGRRWPASGYTPSARFWLGNAQYALKDYKGSIATFRSLIVESPEHPRVPEALLAIANSQIESKDRPGARRTLDDLLKRFPQSEAAAAGRERIVGLK